MKLMGFDQGVNVDGFVYICLSRSVLLNLPPISRIGPRSPR